MKKLVLILILALIGKLSNAQSVEVINITDLQFDIEVQQTGPTILNANDWWGRSEEVVHWLKDTVVLTVTEPQLNAADTVEFSVVFRYGGDSLKIQQRILSDGIDNTVQYKASGTDFSDPWTSNTNFNEQWVTIDTTLILFKYKIEPGTGNLQAAIYKNFIYSIDPDDFTNPNVLNVMSDNIMIVPFNSENFEIRASSFPQYISPYQDVVIFQEVFLGFIEEENLTPVMESFGFEFNSTILNNPELPEVTAPSNGGVIIYSKWPIEEATNYQFTTCVSGSADCLAAKGVKHAKINKLGKVYHVFGTHASRWRCYVREVEAVWRIERFHCFLTNTRNRTSDLRWRL